MTTGKATEMPTSEFDNELLASNSNLQVDTAAREESDALANDGEVPAQGEMGRRLEVVIPSS